MGDGNDSNDGYVYYLGCYSIERVIWQTPTD